MQKNANLVDLEKCCKMSVRLQKSASIQPRTVLSKFAKNWPKVRMKGSTNIGQFKRQPTARGKMLVTRGTLVGTGGGPGQKKRKAPIVYEGGIGN